jgi:fructose-1,6-bisphosphatase/sedoheptulose 1,7-bisphosphatase-like protein
MKNQEYNKGELKELKVKIDKEILDSFERMAKNTSTPIEDLVVIALKRYRSAHGDFDPNSSHSK